MKTCSKCKTVKPLTKYYKDCGTIDGYQYICKACRKVAYPPTDKTRATARKTAKKLKEKLVISYGSKCTCCGEAEIRFLTLEHRNKDGKEHRKKMRSRDLIYRDVLRRGSPPEYTIYCMNCNFAERNGIPCPHKTKTLSLAA